MNRATVLYNIGASLFVYQTSKYGI